MPYRKAVFILAYTRNKKDIEYLLLKRKLHWEGWEFPKGAIKFLETKKNAVKRELKEETGLYPIKIKKFDYSGKYEYEKKIPDRPRFKGQSFVLYAVEVKKPFNRKVKISEIEHSDYKWVNYPKAIKLLRWPNQKESLKIVNDFLKQKALAS
ncbi:NUDIX domain-containing protein [Patescibacteria group bacterium]|nr:NUDIX domain-containing protein [Patescibacteria group bacterium]